MSKKLTERSIAKRFIQTALYNQEYSNQPKKLNEAGFSLGGIGFGKLGNGFSNQPKLTIKTWEDYDDDSMSDSGYKQYDGDESLEGSVDESYESLADEGYTDAFNMYNDNLKPGDHYNTDNMFSDEYSEGDYFAMGDEGAAEKPPKLNKDGNITPKELHKHFDLDGDGDVDMGEYTAHIDFHSKHPELLDKWRKARGSRKDSCKDYSSYCAVGDSFANNMGDVMDFIEAIMGDCGATCHASSAQAIADLVRLLSKNK